MMFFLILFGIDTSPEVPICGRMHTWHVQLTTLMSLEGG
jgi:hypothetical protein